jgi:hypothetical protein
MYVLDMGCFRAESKYTHFALLRSQGAHFGIPGSHLDLRCTSLSLVALTLKLMRRKT